MKARNRFNTRPEHFRESTTREKVLKNIRHALIEPAENLFAGVEFESSVFKPMDEAPDIHFAREFTLAGGNFIFCTSPEDMVKKVRTVFDKKLWEQAWCKDEALTGMLRHSGIKVQTSDENLAAAKVVVTSCEYLLARHGSVMVSSAQKSGRRLHIYPEIHVIIAFTSQIAEDFLDAIGKLRIKYSGRLPSVVSLITGPCRTGAIEPYPQPGGHGPRELYLFMADDVEYMQK